MIGFEVHLGGERLCTASAGNEGVLTAVVTSVPFRKELDLEVGGLVDGKHVKWAVPRSLAVGDEILVRIVETESPDAPSASHEDAHDVAAAAERRYYEQLRRKYGNS